MCDGCRVFRRKSRWHIRCDKNARHNQRQGFHTLAAVRAAFLPLLETTTAATKTAAATRPNLASAATAAAAAAAASSASASAAAVAVAEQATTALVRKKSVHFANNALSITDLRGVRALSVIQLVGLVSGVEGKLWDALYHHESSTVATSTQLCLLS